jgi:S-adenosylmethionine synthetase
MTERNIRVEPTDRLAVEDQEVEIVERKGIGHPDSICDGIAERVSQALAQAYIERVGKPLHYNTDETQLVAGEAHPQFGGGEVLRPIYVLVVGRATKTYEGERIPAETIALDAAREYLDDALPALNVGRDVIVDVRFGEGSGDLQQVFTDGDEAEAVAADGAGTAVAGGRVGVPMANDTSYGVGFAPLTETERIVYETETYLTGEYAADNPAIGPDVKVMGKREGDSLDVTVAVAIVDRHVDDLAAYDTVIEDVRAAVTELAREHTDRDVTVHVNTADHYDLDDGPSEDDSVYLTVTGTSAEQGDDGSVGRGNRANGLITPDRPMSLEASSGKNPVNHIGKLYNLLSFEIAATVVEEVDAVETARVRLLSQIGRPIDEPHLADARVRTAEGTSVEDVQDEVAAIVDRELANVTDVTRRIVEGEIETF